MKTKVSPQSPVVSHKSPGVSNKVGIFPLRLIPYSLPLIFLLTTFFLTTYDSFAQGVAINTTGTAADASAMLDVTSTTQGFLIPRMTLAQRNAIATPATSLLVYQTDGTPGYYYNSGTPALPVWVSLFSANSGWSLTGNDISAATGSFLGTTSNNDLIFKTNNAEVARILANGNMGIGVTNPTAKLEVAGYGQFTNTKSIFINPYWASTAPALQVVSADPLLFVTNNLERVRIDPSGNVGIGITTPGSLVHVRKDQDGVTSLVVENTNGDDVGNSLAHSAVTVSDGTTSCSLVNWPKNHSLPWLADAAGISSTKAGGMSFETSATGNFKWGFNPTELMRLTNAGYLGIGTTTPQSNLHIYRGPGGGLGIANSYFQAEGGDNEDGIAFYTALNNVPAIQSYRDHIFHMRNGDNWVASMLINPMGGRVGIGTTNPEYLFHVSCNGFEGIQVSNTGIGGSSWRFTSGDAGLGLSNTLVIGYKGAMGGGIGGGDTYGLICLTTGNRVGIGTSGPGGQFELSLDQGRKPGTNTWTIVSDARLKNIEGAYTKGLNEILQLQPITYHYKNPALSGVEGTGERKFANEVLNTLNVGFSAQDVQKIFPEAVGTDDDGYLNFNMHAILVAYVNAIKEQQQQIETLQKANCKMQNENQKQQTLNTNLQTEIETLKTIIEKIQQQLAIEARK